LFYPVTLKKFGIGVKFVTTDDPKDFESSIDANTKALYIESIGNPKYNVPNIAALAKVRIINHDRVLIYYFGIGCT
jgi:O-acetylhomoserine/O-acetylserine sulfhydrylase-like pyridoxal-dependent enzyme